MCSTRGPTCGRVFGESLDLLCAARRQKDQETFVLQRSISDLRQELEQLKEELSEATRQKGEHDSNYSLRSAFTPSDLGHGEGMDNDESVIRHEGTNGSSVNRIVVE